MTQTHDALERTSPKGKGQAFVGYCRRCGQQGLTYADMGKPCQQPARKISSDDMLLEVIADDKP